MKIEFKVHFLSSACGRSVMCFVFAPASVHSPKTKHMKLLPKADERLCIRFNRSHESVSTVLLEVGGHGQPQDNNPASSLLASSLPIAWIEEEKCVKSNDPSDVRQS